jgi:hypothetical protein
VDFVTWARRHLGPRRFLDLSRRKKQILKIKPHLKDIAKHYRNEYENMMSLRHAGQEGRIEFYHWEPPDA